MADLIEADVIIGFTVEMRCLKPEPAILIANFESLLVKHKAFFIAVHGFEWGNFRVCRDAVQEIVIPMNIGNGFSFCNGATPSIHAGGGCLTARRGRPFVKQAHYLLDRLSRCGGNVQPAKCGKCRREGVKLVKCKHGSSIRI